MPQRQARGAGLTISPLFHPLLIGTVARNAHRCERRAHPSRYLSERARGLFSCTRNRELLVIDKIEVDAASEQGGIVSPHSSALCRAQKIVRLHPARL
jgi:hypothetical protein